jgi:hypothetical protein
MKDEKKENEKKKKLTKMNRKKLNRKKNLQFSNDLSRWEVCMALLLTAESTLVLHGLLYKNCSKNSPYLES